MVDLFQCLENVKSMFLKCIVNFVEFLQLNVDLF